MSFLKKKGIVLVIFPTKKQIENFLLDLEGGSKFYKVFRHKSYMNFIKIFLNIFLKNILKYIFKKYSNF